MNGIFRWLHAYAFGSRRGVPGLDGLRAVSILLVIVAHLCVTRNFPLSHDSPVLQLGVFGVRIFFVISGYLITSILAAELDRSGSISLKRFYFRRSMRLFPAAYILITVTALAGRLGYLDLSRYDLLFASTYSINYYYGRSFAIGHLWTLAVEEQFYLLWPATLKILGRKKSNSFLLLLVFISPPLRLLSVRMAPAGEFFMFSDTLALGCLLALNAGDLERNARYQRVLHSRWMWVVPFVALAANYTPSTKVAWLLGQPLMNICMVLIVHWSMLNSGSSVGRLLNQPSVVFLGVMSYSLYLWQQIFTYGLHNRLSAFPLNLLMMAAAAMASYLLIEGPCLKLRDRLEASANSGKFRMADKPVVLAP